ncbi:MAG: hypothetical protein Q9191_001973 [Dirinaria sp. TL-2023a]
MQVVSFLSMLFALSASTNASPFAAAPTSSSQNHTLERRIDHYPWIGSAGTDDCHGKPLKGPRPKIYADCVPFASTTNTLSIFWGTGEKAMHILQVYGSNRCVGTPWYTFYRPKTHNGGGCNPVPTGGQFVAVKSLALADAEAQGIDITNIA